MNLLHIYGNKHVFISDIIDYQIFSGINIYSENIINYKNIINIIFTKDITHIIFHTLGDKIDDSIKIINLILNKYNKIKLYYYYHDVSIFYININSAILLGQNLNNLKILQLLILNYFTGVIVPDNFSYKNFEKFNKNKNLKIKIIKHGIFKNNIIGNKEKTDDIRFGFVGRLSEDKGINIFKNLQIDIDFYSNPEFIPNFIDIKKVYKLDTRKEIYSNIDCLIIPSIYNETGPMVLYEAFANKIPVIVSDQESLKEKVIDRVDSYIFKTGDERDLLKGILWMKKNYEKVISNKGGFRYNTIEKFNNQLTNFLNEL